MTKLKKTTKIMLVNTVAVGIFQLVTGWQYPTIAIQRALITTGLMSAVTVFVQLKAKE
jgi:hypothetical protein